MYSDEKKYKYIHSKQYYQKMSDNEEGGALWEIEYNMLEVIILQHNFMGVASICALLIILCIRWELALVMLRPS